jgi:hypothetical protein
MFAAGACVRSNPAVNLTTAVLRTAEPVTLKLRHFRSGNLMNQYFQFGGALLASLPIILVAAIGIWMAIVRRAAHPKSSLIVSLGLLALLCNVVGSAGLQVYAQSYDATYTSEAAYSRNLLVFSIGLYLLQLTGAILITAAVFVDRKPAVRNA